MPKVEITLEDLLNSYDWAEVFADESSGNTTKETSEVPPGAYVSTEPASRKDVAEIIAAVNGENDGEEWIGVFRLKDGRYLVAQGGCDYTGWDCQAGNSMVVAASWNDIIQFGLTDLEKERLGLD
jgi:hypothetical protein